MNYITNIDTLSALVDRLISENIKLELQWRDALAVDTKDIGDVIILLSLFNPAWRHAMCKPAEQLEIATA